MNDDVQKAAKQQSERQREADRDERGELVEQPGALTHTRARGSRNAPWTRRLGAGSLIFARRRLDAPGRCDYGGGMSIKQEDLKFDSAGLIPAIAQDWLTGEVRMMAWMDRASLQATLETKRATFFSRSRQRAWVKGEESGNFLHVRDVYADCDGDTILVLCEPVGPSCHTGRSNCFFQPLAESTPEEEPLAAPILARLERILIDRQSSTEGKSYTKSLLSAGPPKIGAKVREEADEFARALEGETDDRVVEEAADVLYHLLVGLRLRDQSVRRVFAALGRRLGVGGHEEKAARAPKAPKAE